MKEPIGRLGSLIPALALFIASDTRWIASSWPFTRFFKFVSKLSSFSFSPPTNLVTGMLVHLDTILAIDSSSTISLKIVFLLFILSDSNSFFSLL